MEENNLKKSSEIILKRCMNFKKEESCLIIFDKNKEKIANSIFNEAKSISKNVKLLEIPELKINGGEPSSEVANEMLNYDVIIMTTTKSLSHTKARKNASEKGARIASMPGITEETMIRTMSIDYNEVRERNKRLIEQLKNKRIVKVITKLGTDIVMNIEGREIEGEKTALHYEKGDWGNLPGGEVCLAPLEGTTNGIFIVDASMAGIGRIDNPIKFNVKNGYVVDIEGNEKAKKFYDMLKAFNNKNVFNIAELGIGTNHGAKIIGVVLEDEKVLGTAHIAIGTNISNGGRIKAPVHLDGVFTKPTIYVDNKKVIEQGKLLV
jgi:leucyl aminopeptidase (aminopeptidase T)